MKIKLDENLPFAVAGLLQKLGHDVHELFQEALAGQPDDIIWTVTQNEKRFLIAQDLDFSDLRRFAPGSHYGILLVRLRSPNRRQLAERIEMAFRAEDTQDWMGNFVVLTDRKIRVVRPGKPLSE